MTIFIDADGCPVVDQTIRTAQQFGVACTLLCDTSHLFTRSDAKIIIVSKGTDSVDFALVNMVQAGDIVVTQDYGLAAMCLARRATPIRQDGIIYHADNIESLLEERHMAKKIRMSGGKVKGNAKRTEKMNQDYIRSLKALLTSRTEKQRAFLATLGEHRG